MNFFGEKVLEAVRKIIKGLYFTASSTLANTLGSFSARSAKFFLSSLTFFFCIKLMSWLYFIPFNLAAALIFTFQRDRKSLFLSFRPRKAWVQAWSKASLAALSLDFLPQRKPLVYFRIFARRLLAIVPRFTLVIVYKYL